MLGHRRRALVVASGLLALSACCKNSNPLTGGPPFSCSDLDGDVCTPGLDAGPDAGGCADHTYCLPVQKSDPDYATAEGHDCNKCYLETRPCTSSAECCPGQTCNTSLKLCFDCYNLDATGACGQSNCTSDADCVTLEGPGHICQTFNSPDGGAPQIPTETSGATGRCSYPTCQTDADCAAGSSCFPEGAKPNGYCVSQPPCNGPCRADTACAVTDDLCSTVPEGVAACQQTCAAGSMLVFVNQSVPTGVYDACNLPAVTCDCAILPPISSDDLGRYSSLAAASGQVWVSGYDGEYGDLVAYHFSPDGGLIDLESVDGVPSTCTLVADPNGYRGGCATAGPNVGEWTSLALGSDGQPRISYYDVDHTSLKFAQRQSSGKWVTSWVDGWDGTSGTPDGGDVGSYTSIAMNANGMPVISYFQAAGPTAPLQTALKLAVATVASPTSASDWTTSIVDSANKPAPPCFPATCTNTETCVGTKPTVDGGAIELPDGGCEPAVPPDNGGNCLTTATTCGSGDAGCSSSEACVNGADGGAATCMPTFAATSFTDLVQGVGLFSSLAFDSTGNTLIAYYDRLHGALRLAKGTAGAFTVTTIDGIDPASCESTGNVGLFPNLKVNGATLAIAYQDQDTEELLYWTGPTPAYIAPSQRVVIDTGTIQAPSPNNAEITPMFIGAGVSLAFGQSGTAYFAYQNQTQISLRLSSEPAGCGTSNPAACTVSVINEWTAEPEGFYSQVAIDGTQGYTCSAQIQALANGVDDRLIMQTPLSLP
jgi:hypothetical protein